VTTVALPSHDLGTFTSSTPLEQAVWGFMGTITNTGTYRLYYHALNEFIGWAQGHGIDIMTAVRGQVEPYLRHLQAGGYEKELIWHPYSESTISAHWGVLRGFFKYAVEEQLIVRDPCVRISTPTVDPGKQHRTYLPPLAFAAFMAQAMAMTPRECATLSLLCLRGIRIAEACSLDVASMQNVKGQRTITYVGKGDKLHKQKLPIEVAYAIDMALEGRQVGPLLLNARGSRLTRSNATYLIKKCARLAGVDENISPHSMRRSFATYARSTGVSLTDLQMMMGHADPKTTMIYDQMAQDLGRDQSQSVASHLMMVSGN
jgi:integrase/recombinase XerD